MSVKIENLSFAYGTHQVLKNISLEVGDGTLVNVLGPNGTGKSTLFRCILGLYTSYNPRCSAAFLVCTRHTMVPSS